MVAQRKRTPKNWRAIPILLGAVIGIVIVYACCFRAYWVHQRVLRDSHPTVRFLHGVSFTRIHFRSQNGDIRVTAYINGLPRECTLDTGAIPTNLPHPRAGAFESLPARLFHSIDAPLPGSPPRPLEFVSASSIQLGDYRVENAAVRSFARMPHESRRPLLGIDLFRNVALTIDWAAETLTIAAPNSAAAPRQITGWDKIIFYPVTVINGHADNRVILRGTIDGSPSLLLFDTGQFIDSLCIVNPSLAQRLAVKQGDKFAPGVQLFHEVNWTFAGDQFQTEAYSFLTISGPFQGLVGTPYLSLYRVGIDFPAHRFYLHRYRSSEHLSKSIVHNRWLYFGRQ